MVITLNEVSKKEERVLEGKIMSSILGHVPNEILWVLWGMMLSRQL